MEDKKGKIIDFKSLKEGQVINVNHGEQTVMDFKIEDELKRQYLDKIGLKAEEIMNKEQLEESIREVINAGDELVCRTPDEALILSAILIEMPEFNNVSHFEFVSCQSLLSNFIRLKPVEKTEKNYLFPKNDMIYAMSFIAIEEYAKANESQKEQPVTKQPN